jgi:hypothetical protein
MRVSSKVRASFTRANSTGEAQGFRRDPVRWDPDRIRDAAEVQSFVRRDAGDGTHGDERLAFAFERELLERPLALRGGETADQAEFPHQLACEGVPVLESGVLDDDLAQVVVADDEPVRQVSRVIDDPDRRASAPRTRSDRGRARSLVDPDEEVLALLRAAAMKVRRVIQHESDGWPRTACEVEHGLSQGRERGRLVLRIHDASPELHRDLLDLAFGRAETVGGIVDEDGLKPPSAKHDAERVDERLEESGLARGRVEVADVP